MFRIADTDPRHRPERVNKGETSGLKVSEHFPYLVGYRQVPGVISFEWICNDW
jgi:hypothetical protein